MSSIIDALDVDLSDQDKADLKLAVGEDKFTNDQVKNLYIKRAEIYSGMLSMRDDVSKEGWTADHKNKFDQMEVDVKLYDSAIDHQEKLRRLVDIDIEFSQKKKDAQTSESKEGIAKKEQKNVYETWLRAGFGHITPDQIAQHLKGVDLSDTNTLVTTTPATAGYLAPDEYYNRMIEVMRTFGGVYASL